MDSAESPDRGVVNALGHYHRRVYPECEAHLRWLAEDDSEFYDRLVEWGNRTGTNADGDGIDEIVEGLARQYAFLLLIRSLSEATTGVTNPTETDDGNELVPSVEEPSSVRRLLSEFAQEVDRAQVDSNAVGEAYQRVMGRGERRRLGQYYTPPQIAGALAEWAVRSPNDRVLDPCCGSGVITQACVDRAVELGAEPEGAVERTAAFDVNGVAARICAHIIGTTVSANATESIEEADFFDVFPTYLDTEDNSKVLPQVDATVANPPYVRQEELQPGKDRYRHHLRRLGHSGEYLDGNKAISGRADLYCYFLTHATEFLKDGGRLAWLIPTKWMLSEYGESVRRFIYDHYRVRAIASVEDDLFDDALVDTVLLFLERESNPSARDDTTVRFVRFWGDPTTSELLEGIQVGDVSDDEQLNITVREGLRSVAIEQRFLSRNPTHDIYHYLNAPHPYTVVREHPDTVPLSTLGDVSYGKKTGANEIFLLSREEAAEREIESDVLVPAVKSVREVDGVTHSADDAVHFLFAATPDRVGGGLSGTTGSEALRNVGLGGAADYVREMKDHASANNESVSGEGWWFDVGRWKTAPVVVPLAMDTSHPIIRTDGEVVASNRFALFDPCDDVDVKATLAVLNSSVTALSLESRGRVTGGGAINFAVSDLADLQVIDTRALEPERRKRLRALFDRLDAGDETARKEIDEIVVDALELPIDSAKFPTLVEQMQRRRRGEGGDNPPQRSAEYSIEKREEGQRTLDSFG